ncbi:MAG: GHKL domain-containing protein [Clostridia bacterium]|nr:GHKL domain-containing protein [Clostridia bacterium]
MIEIIASFVDAVICIFFIRAFLNRDKKNLPITIATVLIYYGITLIGDRFLPGFSVVITIVLLLVSFVYALLICKKHYIKAIICTCTYKIVYIVSSSLIFAIISMIFNDYGIMMQGSGSGVRLTMLLIHKVFLTASFILIVVLFSKGEINDKLTGVIVFAISLLTIIGLGVTMVVMGIEQNSKTTLPLLFQIIVFVLVNIGMYLLVYRVRKLEKQKYELKLLNDKYELQQGKYSEAIGVWNNVRKVQHDIKEHLTMINRLLHDNRIDDCKEYVDNLIPVTNTMGKIISSDNLVLDYLINSKLCALENTEVIISGVVGDLSDIDNRDLVTIFGNIIDNAIEAISELDEKRIEILFTKQDENRIIICKNTIGKSVLENNREMKSTKKDSGSHGLGHMIVEETVVRLGGMIHYSESGGMFCVQIVLPGLIKK